MYMERRIHQAVSIYITNNTFTILVKNPTKTEQNKLSLGQKEEYE